MSSRFLGGPMLEKIGLESPTLIQQTKKVELKYISCHLILKINFVFLTFIKVK